MTWGKDDVSRARESFEELWPDLARGLESTLRARRIPSSRREDIIQETGLRLFVRWSDLDPDKPVWPFALTVAMNLVKDEQRMQARRSGAPQPAGDSIERGVEEEALARLELNRIQIALQELTPAQRSVVLADLGEAPYDDRGPAALKMLRMRARRALRSVIDRASAAVPIAGLQIRRAANSVGVSLHRSGIEHAQLVILSTLGVAGAATIIGAALGVEAPERRPSSSAPEITLRTASIYDPEPARAPSALDGRTGGEVAAVSARRLSRGDSEGRRHQSSAGPAPAEATLGAGGTGIDDDASLRSGRFRVWVFARAAASGHKAAVDYEVEQSNPVCGSPAGTSQASRSCIRAEPPRARGRSRVGDQSVGEVDIR